MAELRAKSLKLTAYLEQLLDKLSQDLDHESAAPTTTTTTIADSKDGDKAFTIITPRDPSQRGAQLSLRLAPGMMDKVMHVLEEESVVVDERRPDVIRVAPAPLYNTFTDVLRFVRVFGKACRVSRDGSGNDGVGEGRKKESIMGDGGRGEKGWSEVK